VTGGEQGYGVQSWREFFCWRGMGGRRREGCRVGYIGRWRRRNRVGRGNTCQLFGTES